MLSEPINNNIIYNISTFSDYRHVHPSDKNDIAAQVRMAAQCCKLADAIISQCDTLWTVPDRLIEQARSMHTKSGHGKRNGRKLRITKTTEPIHRSNDFDHVYKIVV